MGVIKQLPTQVANQISAGEVVERPSSIVKELIENSIDAGSTRILIEIEDGGRKKIRIKDNGKGIAEDDLELAFSRYATSKIQNANDLYSIKTLGFRGEALASIASVSKIQISSRSKDAIKGNSMKLVGGEIQEKKPIGMPTGTDIIVKDIFYNTPARFKYLKKINTEFGHISNVVTREALAFPEIKFTLIHNDKKLMETAGTGKLIDSIFASYGQEIVDNLIPIEYEESYVKLSGYIGKANLYRSSRIYELFFVNKRSVYNRSLSRGVEAAYYGLLAPGKYPIVFLKLKLNQILVDVNIHPSKREIKFSRDEIIENVIKKGIKKTLDKTNTTVEFNFKRKTNKESASLNKKEYNPQSLDFNQNIDQYENKSFKFHNQINDLNINEKKEEYIDSIQENKEATNNTKDSKDFAKKNKKTLDKSKDNYDNEVKDNKNITYNKKKKPFEDNNKTIYKNRNVENENNYNNKSNKSSYSLQNINKKNRQDKLSYPKEIKQILGQIHKTYIILECSNGLYIVDQHNAHERVLYDNFYKKFNEKTVRTQSLLLPINLELSLEEKEIIKKYQKDLKEIGIVVKEFGSNSFIITEIPIIFKNLSSKQTVKDIIDNLFKYGKTLNTTEIIENTISYMSCRSAVKAGAYLDQQEIEKIIIDLFKTSNPNRCPHGRPIIIKFSIDEINKSMGR
ncbi:DNA mismatch repair endonuclease MutL [Natronospora cellulosivora (SeqCode)]